MEKNRRPCMKRTIFLSIIFGATAGFITNTVCTHPVLAVEEKSVTDGRGKSPTERLMMEIEKRTYNILTGILLCNFSQVKQEASAVVEEANKINEKFFPQNPDPDVDTWYKRTKNLDTNNKEAIVKLKEEFTGYVKKIETAIQKIQRAADSKNEESALNAYTDLIKNSCFECHKHHRG